MHMADALVSPAVGGGMWAASLSLLALSARRIRVTLDGQLVPMMGVLGAFIFALQMINFSIPLTGSSGHLGGGLLLAILLGPCAAFVVIASVLAVQALFFADGGLLALGCNIFNLGFFPAFVAYPLVYRPIAAGRFNGLRAWTAAIIAAVVALQLGSLGVVLQTTVSGISELPLGPFLTLMQPIHLVIGLVEGVATALLVNFIGLSRPELFAASTGSLTPAVSWRPVLAALIVAAILCACLFSWLASPKPDGLEWSVGRVSSGREIGGMVGGVHQKAAALQQSTALLPDYGFRAGSVEPPSGLERPWPAVDAGTSLSGAVGGLLTLSIAAMAGWGLCRRRRPD